MQPEFYLNKYVADTVGKRLIYLPIYSVLFNIKTLSKQIKYDSLILKACTIFPAAILSSLEHFCFCVCLICLSMSNAQLRFTVGGLLIGFAKSNSPKARKISESGRIIPFRQGI